MTAQAHDTICMLCSLGCGLAIETAGGDPARLEYRKDLPGTGGRLCAKGNYALEILNHPMRLTDPRESGLPVGWNRAVARIAEAFRNHSAAVVVEGDLSEEEAVLLDSFAEACRPAGGVAVSIPTGDLAVLRAIERLPVPWATLEDLERSACTIAVGDPFRVGPVVAGPVLAARNSAAGHALHAIGPAEGMTARFAKARLAGPERMGLLALLSALLRANKNAPPAWAKDALAKLEKVDFGASREAAERMADGLLQAAQGVMLVGTADPVAATLAACCAPAAGKEKRFFPIHDYGNARGIARRAALDASVPDILAAARAGRIEALLVLGADLAASYPNEDAAGVLGGLKFLAAGALFSNRTTALAQVVLPTAAWLEKDGTFGGRPCRAVVPPAGGARSYGEILRLLAQALRIDLVPGAGRTAVREEAWGPKDLAGLLDEALASEFAQGIRSTEIHFSDRAITGHLSWPRALVQTSSRP
ncbi:MAG: hypothetical protein V1918_07845 [Planctomycetota bacterium]